MQIHPQTLIVQLIAQCTKTSFQTPTPKPRSAPHLCLQSSLSSRMRQLLLTTLWCQESGGKGADEDFPAPPRHCFADLTLAGIQTVRSGVSITSLCYIHFSQTICALDFAGTLLIKEDCQVP